MKRFLLGLGWGVVLTVEAFALAGVGHGTYGPLVVTASVAGPIPVLGLTAGPLIWGFYFVLIPNLERSWSQMAALSFVFVAHVGAGIWLAYEDPAFARADSTLLLVFGITLLATIGCLLFLCVLRRSPVAR
jgi:hypothetical protein